MLQAILILYLTQKLGFSDNQSFNVFGAYVALSSGLTIIGGFFADKILGFYNATGLGAMLIFLGNLILMQLTLDSFYLGIAFAVVGIGFLKPSNPSLTYIASLLIQ